MKKIVSLLLLCIIFVTTLNLGFAATGSFTLPGYKYTTKGLVEGIRQYDSYYSEYHHFVRARSYSTAYAQYITMHSASGTYLGQAGTNGSTPVSSYHVVSNVALSGLYCKWSETVIQ